MILSEISNFMDEVFIFGILCGLATANTILDLINIPRYGQLSTGLLISIILLALTVTTPSFFDAYSDLFLSVASATSMIIFFIALDKVITQQTQSETIFFNHCIICISLIICVFVFFILPHNLSFYLTFFCIFFSLICEIFYALNNLYKSVEHRFYHMTSLVVVITTLLLYVYFIKFLLTSEARIFVSYTFLIASLLQQFVILLMKPIDFRWKTDTLIKVDQGTHNEVFDNSRQLSLFIHEARNQLSIFNLTLSSLLRQPLSEAVEKKVYNLFTAYHEISILIDHYSLQYELASNMVKNETVAINTEDLLETLKQLHPSLYIANDSKHQKIFIADKQNTIRLLRLSLQSILLFFGKKATVTLETLILDNNTSFQFKITDTASLSDKWLTVWGEKKEEEQQERQKLLLAYIRTVLAFVRKHNFNIYVFTDYRGDSNLMLSIFHQSDRAIRQA